MGSGGLLHCDGLKKLLDWKSFPTLPMMASHVCVAKVTGSTPICSFLVLVRETFFQLPF